MINLAYLENKLPALGYQAHHEESAVFWKRIKHDNFKNIYAFTLIIITLDKFTVTVEGMNELLINSAMRAGAISITTPEELDALREIAYDYTLEEVARFETIFNFFENQLDILQNTTRGSDEQEACLKNIKTIVEAANAVEF